jgi:hypothetical protein
MSDTKFPGPYVNTCKIDDPIMIRVNLDKMDIGARSSGMPKGGLSNGMSLDHVGSSAGKK